jgi:TfoX/Sxy family transcriptional regulator of competence genes
VAYDQGLAQRVDEILSSNPLVTQKKMFGGLCFLLQGNMLCGIQDKLMVRVGPDQYQECLNRFYTREMDFTGKTMKGMIYVDPEGIEEDAALEDWIEKCLKFVGSLPPKVNI